MFREGSPDFWRSDCEFPAAAVRLSLEKRPHGPAGGWVLCDAAFRVQVLAQAGRGDPEAAEAAEPAT